MTTLHITYDGPALRDHRMEVRDLAPALLAVGELLEAANEVLNGAKTSLNVQVVASFKTGSFGIQIEVGNLVQQALQLVGLDGASAKQILEYLGLIGKGVGGVVGLITVLKWIKNRPIQKIELISSGQVRVMVDGSHIDVEQRVISLLQNLRVRRALEQAIKPLEREGIDLFAATTNPDAGFETVEKSEIHWFVVGTQLEEIVSDQEITRNLQLENVAFKDDNKWRFTDGASSFFAVIMDPVFNEQINNNAPITKGDVLKARVRERQSLKGGTLRTEYEVLEVLEHRRGGQQISLPLHAGPPA